MKKVFNLIAGFILKAVPVLFVVAFIVTFASCATTQVTNESTSRSYTIKNRKGTFRVTHTYIRKVDTLAIKN